MSFAKFGGERLPDLQMGDREGGERDGEVNGVGAVGDGGGEGVGGEEDGWQDMQTYEREQEITEGEVGARHGGLQDGGEVPRVKGSKSVPDKEERKRKRKEKRRRERRDFNEKKAKEKAAEI